MIKYIIKRLLLIVPVVLAVILLVFAILYVTPGSSIRRNAVLEGDGFDSVLQRIAPGGGFLAHYLRYCYNVIVNLDFGSVGRHQTPVTGELIRHWGWTLKLAGRALLVSACIGIPLGIIAAVYSGSAKDKFISVLTTAFSSIPSYCLALALALFFALYLKVLPSNGVQKAGCLVLPVTTVSAMGIAQFIRVVRAAVLETLEKNYITALRAAGIRERMVIGMHALRNALVPITASFCETAAKILGGSFIAEQFFAVPGVGYYLIRAVTQLEHNIILACAVSMSVLLVLLNLAGDLLCLAADPQLRRNIKDIR